MSVEARNPFPGLRPYEPEESDLFFGREDDIFEVKERLESTRFLAVVGSSGSGKSSLIRAGVLPALQSTLDGDLNAPWHVAILRPGNHPIAELAIALEKPEALDVPAEAANAFVQTSLRAGPLSLIEIVRKAGLPPRAKLLILVDQFEELFRFVQEQSSAAAVDEARAFIKLLLEAAAQQELPIYVLITMRTDFMGACTRYPALPEAINNGIYLVPKMSYEQLRDAIREPALVGGGTITDRLVNRLLSDMGDDPDQLPLLQHVLMRLWSYQVEQHLEGPLDLDSYKAVGAVGAALNKHAEEAYKDLTPAEQTAAVALFKSITTTIDSHLVRRPMTLREITARTGAKVTDLTGVIEKFRRKDRSFLMPPASVPLTPETIIDISHESLIRNWRTLKSWADDDARIHRMYQNLQDNAELWRDNERRNSYLYSGTRLQEIQEHIKSAHWKLSPEQVEFLTASRHRRALKRLLWWSAAAVAFIAAGIYGYMNYASHRQADQFETLAASQLSQLTDQLSAQLKQSHLISDMAFDQLKSSPNNLTIQYFARPADRVQADTVKTTLEKLGFHVTFEQPHSEDASNCLWYGSGVAQADYQLAALALVQTGVPLRDIQPISDRDNDDRKKVMQFGYRALSRNNPLLTVDAIEKLNASGSNAAAAQPANGTVEWVNAAKGYGFIKNDSGQDVFVHLSAADTPDKVKELSPGVKVQFLQKPAEKGPLAEQVKVIVKE